MSEPTSVDVRAAVGAIRREVDRLCNGGRWQMSIPVNEMHDSDRVIDNALALLTERLARLEEYAVHKHECAIRLPHLRSEPNPCDCGLAALLPPATEGR